MPAPRRRLHRELFETRSHSWQEVGLGHELEAQSPGRALGGLVIALVVLAATLVVYYRRQDLLPGYGPWVRAATVAILIIVGSAGSHWLVRWVSPRLFRRVDPATAGTLGFLIRSADAGQPLRRNRPAEHPAVTGRRTRAPRRRRFRPAPWKGRSARLASSTPPWCREPRKCWARLSRRTRKTADRLVGIGKDLSPHKEPVLHLPDPADRHVADSKLAVAHEDRGR